MLSVEVEREECFALAIIMYYFYLAAFFWMLNIAFNVARFDPPPPPSSQPPQIIFVRFRLVSLNLLRVWLYGVTRAAEMTFIF
jgi:hypothetical protein